MYVQGVKNGNTFDSIYYRPNSIFLTSSELLKIKIYF